MRSSYPGHLPVAAGRTLSIEPRTCGVLKVGAGRLAVDGNLLQPSDELRLRAGEAVEIANPLSSTAYFAWDACAEQPTLRERLLYAAVRFGRLVRGQRAEVAACGPASWCVRA